MWKADVDPKIVEKAIVNLNGMVFEAQKRYRSFLEFFFFG